MPIRLARDGAVARLILDRPPANTYEPDLLRELGGAIDEARLDESVHALLVESALPKFFSAGADVAAMKQASSRRRAMTVLLAHEVFRKLEETPLLVVAAITGHCLGGGFELALACDLRFACRGDYRLGLPETSLGLLPGSGGTQRLPRLVGRSRALELIATARMLTPEEAHGLGAVDRLLDGVDACHAAALELCQAAARGASLGIGEAKIAVSVGSGGTLDAGLALERAGMGRIFETHDAEEGMAAFLEKRAPRFERR